MKITEVLSVSSTDHRAQAWIDRVYDLYPATWENNHVMTWEEGDQQQLAFFELIPSMSKKHAVEVKWFQAYPLRQGVGSRAMQQLQALAREDGIALTLYPWDKGRVSQAKLTKFYKGQGFKPTVKGAKNMMWTPETVVEGLTQDRNLSSITKKYIKDHVWKLTTVNPMTLDIDSFDDPFNRVIDIDTDYQVDFKQPIIVHANGTTIIDGFHRAYQAQIQGLKQIPAYVPVKQDVTESQSVVQEIKEFINSLAPDDVGVEEFPGYRVHFEGFTDDCKSSSDYQQNPDAVYQQVYRDFIDREGGVQPVKSGMVGDEDYPVLYSVFKAPQSNIKHGVAENFADGKGPGRPGDSVRHGIPKHATMALW